MKKFFTSDKVFFGTVLLSCVVSIGFTVLYLIYDATSISRVAINIIMCPCFIVLYVSYKKHNKNIMKGLMGALLMAYLINSVQYITFDYTLFNSVCSLLFFAFTLILFVTHFVINGSRQSSPAGIRLNQSIIVCLTVLNIIWVAPTESQSGLFLAIKILDIVSSPLLYAVIVCIESRLDSYRQDRENAGWTEEVGYSEGYVHEYERRQ